MVGRATRIWAVGIVPVVLLVGGRARAEEFTVLGPRAMGMGGAGVAVTRGSLSNYWNPAGLAPPRTPSVDSFFDAAIPVGVGGTTSEGLLRDLSEVIDIVEATDFDDIEARIASNQSLTSDQLRNVLRLADELPDLARSGTGLLSDVDVSVSFRIWRFGFSALGMFHGGARTVVDTSSLALGSGGLGAVLGSTGNLPGTAAGQEFADRLVSVGVAARAEADELAFQAEQAGVNLSDPRFQRFLDDVLTATQGASPASQLFTSNQSGVNLRGILLTEIGLGYSQPLGELIPVTPFDWVSVGVTAKAMYGTTYFQPVTLVGLDGFGDVVSEILSNSDREESVEFGVDVGALVQPFDWLAFGVVGRNLNGPEFDFGGPGNYEVEPQARAGIGLIDFLPGLTFALDIDLTKNQTDALPGYESQVIAGGLEYSIADLDAVFLRGGVSYNLAQDDGIVIHGGLGVRFLGVSLDLAIMASTETSDTGGLLDGADELPERIGASAQVALFVPLD